MPKITKKALIIRFSSLGDIVQCLSAANSLKTKYPDMEIHWSVRSDFATLLRFSPDIDHLHVLHRKDGIIGLFGLAKRLRKEQFTHIYDAHANLRSYILSLFLTSFWTPQVLSARPFFIRRSKHRFRRWLLFRKRVNTFSIPFRGADSFLSPIKTWGIEPISCQQQLLLIKEDNSPLPSDSELSQTIAIGPSAAWDNKRWPITHWIKLISLLPQHKFILLGGPEDHFCKEIQLSAPNRITNLAGSLTWNDSAYCILKSRMLVCGDTGLLHIADLLGKQNIGLIGPSAFGYPSRPNSQVLEVPLPCKPCSKDGRDICTHENNKECMVTLSPNLVQQTIKDMLIS